MQNDLFSKRKTASSKRVFRCALRHPPPRRTFVDRLNASEAFTLEVFDETDADFLDQAVSNINHCWRRQGNGRYSDGTFNVVYTADTKEVAIAERAFHFLRNMPDDAVDDVQPGFFIFELQLSGPYEDYSLCTAQNIELVEPYSRNEDGLDYHPRCARLAKEERVRVGFLVVPSARKLKGRCVPVLKPEAVQSESVKNNEQFAFTISSVDRAVIIVSETESRKLSIDNVADDFTCEVCSQFIPATELNEPHSH